MKTQIFFDDFEDLLDIRRDDVFKAVFTKDTAASRTALSRLVSAVIDRDVQVVALNANEPAAESVLDRQIRFDIHCKTDRGEPVNVEMSLHPKPFEAARLEFHAAKLFVGQDIKGADKTYADLRPAYQIAFLARERFFGDGEFFHRFEYHDPVRGVSLGGRSRVFTLELSKLKGVVGKDPEEMTPQEMWLVFFEYLTDPSKRGIINAILRRQEGIAMAGEMLAGISRDEIERAVFLSREKNELDWQSSVAHAERVGMAKGIQEGMEKGMAKGIQEGERRVLELVAKGYALEDIRRELADG